VFPGARFGHVTNILEKSLDRSHPNLKYVFIQVGINHRGDREVPARQLKTVMEAVHAAGAIYVGISYAFDLPGKQRMCIDTLNEVARNLFDKYVKPLHPRDVTLRNGDEQHIHFDDRTVDRVLHAIIKAHDEDHTYVPDVELGRSVRS